MALSTRSRCAVFCTSMTKSSTAFRSSRVVISARLMFASAWVMAAETLANMPGLSRVRVVILTDTVERCAISQSTSTTSRDRKSTRLNSSHDQISYAVFCLKKKKIAHYITAFYKTEQSAQHD